MKPVDLVQKKAKRGNNDSVSRRKFKPELFFWPVVLLVAMVGLLFSNFGGDRSDADSSLVVVATPVVSDLNVSLGYPTPSMEIQHGYNCVLVSGGPGSGRLWDCGVGPAGVP